MNRPRVTTHGYDPALLRGLTQSRISRRRFLRGVGLGAGAAGLSAFLAACGVKGAASTSGASSSVGSSSWWARQHLNHVLHFASWPYYIDTHQGQHPSLVQFTKQTGITVDYKPVINDNAAFFATIEPALQQGKPTGWDLMIITNGSQLTQLIDFRWLIPLDHSKLPNFLKYASPLVRGPSWDPGNRYTVAWQSGFTGMAYGPKAVQALGHVPNSIDDLWNPALKGKVGMMSDNTELGSVALLKLGIDPQHSTVADWRRAAAALDQQKKMGLVRNYYDQSYINALENGDTWITQAWSGDIFIANQSGYPDLKFLVPTQGVMFWTDNLMIPLHAQDPLDAITYMNYVYEPSVAAELAAYINYVTPVPAAQPIIQNRLHNSAVATSPLVFPTPAIRAKARNYFVYRTHQDLQAWNSIFEPIIQS